jgi:hypothetical protein
MAPPRGFTAPMPMTGPRDSALLRIGAVRIKAKSFTIDGEAVVLGPDGLSQFEELSYREAADTAILYAFGLMSMTTRIGAVVHSSNAGPLCYRNPFPSVLVPHASSAETPSCGAGSRSHR